MKDLFKLIFNDYKTNLAPMLVLELTRGFLIIIIAWLFQLGIRNAELGIIFLILIVFALRLLIENFRTKRFNKLSLDFQESIRRKLHSALFKASSSRLNSGELLTLIFDTVEAFDDFFVKVLPNIFTIVILVPLIIIVSAIVDPLTAVIFLLTLPVAPFLLYLVGNAVSQKNQIALDSLNKLNSDFKELLAAITTLKIFKQSKSAFEKLKTTSIQSAQTTLDVLKLAFISAFVLELITTLSIALIAVTVGLRLLESDIVFDIALFLLILAPEFYSPIRQIGAAFHSFIKARDALANVELRIKNAKLEETINQTPHSAFCILHSALNIIAGQSGSGKTTLIKSLIRKYLSKGKQIAYLPQQPHLFKASIRDNLTLFKTVDDSILIDILRHLKLDFKLDDVVLSMSRGQLQRFGLARALIMNSDLLILDEPTASLDNVTRQIIIDVILEHGHDRTVIIATHDPIIINHAQHLINLDDIT